MKTTTRCSGFSRRSPAVWAALPMAAWMGCAPAPPPREAGISVVEVETAFKTFAESWEREDLETAAGAFAPDAVVFDPVPPGKFEGVEGIRTWISGSFDSLETISISTSQLRVRISGKVAWGTAHFVFEARQAGQPLRAEGYVSTVWVQQAAGPPKLSVFHASHLPAPAGA